ncbi:MULTISPECIES: biotin--[acetyl-CoA-carboxylase] ligase [Gracilibacillus]|uniref:biotin--[acetyl-CoA-carboxylase] ligase n=1 Tax=Gracilibacillus TaxID=74385 RepID=UPI0008248AB5|nr:MULTISPECIES: biotin--[acetyl-CoA-carboxylase] ligase [Gracilibacillus]
MAINKRQQLITILANHADDYISGQAISDQLNISRTAVWKHINELKKAGYQFESVPRKGYRLLARPTALNDHTVQWGLETDWLGQTIIFQEEMPSTQDLAHELARKDYPHGTVVLTNFQQAGRGRMERVWESNNHGGIWLSLLLRPNIPPYQASQMTLFVAVTLVETLERLTDQRIEIKWPNDLFINGKKICGILTEMQAELEAINYLVIGFGINVNQTSEDFPERLQDRSTSLQMETKQYWNRSTIIQAILKDFEYAYQRYLNNGFDEVKQKWLQHAYRLNQTLTIKQHHDVFEAQIEGINHDGALLVKTENGKQRMIYSAEIDW